MAPLQRAPTATDEAGASTSSLQRVESTAPASDRWSLVVVAGLAIYMAQLDTTIVNIALPAIEADLGVATSTTQWIVLAYLVPLIGLSLLAGRWLDTIGHRAALTVSVVGFAAASVAAGAASTAAGLILARAAQGTFGALLLSLAPVLAVTAVGRHARARALGVVGALAPLGAMSGPVIGGLLVDTLGWGWIFYTNVPVAVLILLLGRAGLPARQRLRLPHRGWALEAAVLGSAAVAVLLATTLAIGRGWIWAGLALMAPPLVLLWRRMAVARPVLALLSIPGMPAVHAALAVCYTVLLLVQFLTPFFLTRTLGASAAVAGFALLPLPAATAVMGPLAGVFADRFDPRRIALAGAVLITVAVAFLAPLSAQWTVGALAWRLALLGGGVGLLITPASTLAMTIAPRDLLGVTSASTNLARYVGLALGPAVATAAWAALGYRIEGMRMAVGVAFAVSLILVVALGRSRPEVPQQPG